MALSCRAWQRADAGAGADLRGYGGDAVTYCGILSIGVPLSDAGKLAIISPARPNSVTDVVSIRTAVVIRALVTMHMFGHPVDIDAVQAVAHDFKLALVEDAAGR